MTTIPVEHVYWRIEWDGPEHEAAQKREEFARRMLAEHAALHEHFAVVTDHNVFGSISPLRVNTIQSLADNVARGLGCKAIRVSARDVFPNG